MSLFTDEVLDPLLIEVPDQLRGARVQLRPFRAGDGQAVWEAIEETRTELCRWEDWPVWHSTPAHSEVAVRRLMIRFLARECLYYAVLSGEDARFLGWAGLEEINWRTPSFQLGFWIRHSAARRGLMTEAVSLLCDLSFGPLRGNRLALLAQRENDRSIALARRLGFVHEGTLENERINPQGQPQVTLVFAHTRRSYRPGTAGRGTSAQAPTAPAR